MPAARWHALFEELGRLGVQSVCLSGGEVFTRPYLFELIDGVIANRMRYSILTNGTLITEETLKEFAKGKRCLRLLESEEQSAKDAYITSLKELAQDLNWELTQQND